MRAGRVHDVDAVELAKGLDIAPVISQKHHLVESQHVAAIFDVVHADLHAGAAPAGRWCVDIACDHTCVQLEGVRFKELHKRYRLSHRP